MLGNLTEREKELLRILSEEGDRSLADISNELSVSTVTLRNDLNRLAERGFIIRTRGGGSPAFHPSILTRQGLRKEEKTRIAKAAAEMIDDGDRIMISTGTTTAQIARYLLGKRDVHIVTNSTLILPFARMNPALRVTLVGGEFRPSAEALLGPMGLKALKGFHVTKAFFGADGFSLDAGLTADYLEMAEVVRQMVDQAEKKIVVTDSSKYGKRGFAYMVPLEQMDLLITDDGLPVAVRKALEEGGIEVKLV